MNKSTMSINSAGAHAPRSGAVAALSLIALVAIATIVIQVISAPDVAGVYGWITGPDARTITSVTPGYPAAKAGVRPGDVVDYRSLNLLGRENTVVPQALYAGAPLTVRFARSGAEKTVTMTATTRAITSSSSSKPSSTS